MFCAAAAGPWAAGAYLPNGAFATQGPFGAAAAAAQGQTIMATQGTGAGGATPGGQGGGQDAAAAAAALAAGGLAGAGMFTTPSYKPGGGRGSYQVNESVSLFKIDTSHNYPIPMAKLSEQRATNIWKCTSSFYGKS